MGEVTVSGTCPFCGKGQTVQLDAQGFALYRDGVSIQDALPAADAFEREFVISGICFGCQSAIFGRTVPDRRIIRTDRHQPEEGRVCK